MQAQIDDPDEDRVMRHLNAAHRLKISDRVLAAVGRTALRGVGFILVLILCSMYSVKSSFSELFAVLV